MERKYEIVEHRAELRDALVRVQRQFWSPDVALNTAYLEWKYDRNPYLDGPVIYVALCDGEVVGMRGMYGAKWEIGRGAQTFLGPCAGDLVIAPEHRNRGLFTMLTMAALNDLTKRGYTYVFNLSAGLATQFGSLTIGWRSVGPVQTARWQPRQSTICTGVRSYASRLPFLSSAYRRVRRYANRLLLLSSGDKRHPFSSLDSNGARHCREATAHVTIEQTPRPDAMAELVARIPRDGRIRHVRDQQYFAWRFQNPLAVYRFLLWEDARLEGYLVLRTSVVNPDRVGVSIVDWEASNAQVRAELLEAAVEWGNFADLTIWSSTLPVEAKTLLQNSGFQPLDEPQSIGRAYREGASRPTVLIRPVRDEMVKTDWVLAGRGLLDLGNWDLRMIYSDNY